MFLTLAPPLHSFIERRPTFDLEEMTLEEKVGQTIITYFRGKKVDSEAERLIREYKVGGIILYTWANDLSNARPSEVRDLNSHLQEIAAADALHPLIIGVDQEGGEIKRLVQGFTEFPGNAALGRTKDPELAYEAARAMGEELREVGINMNFAPVVDVHSNRNNWVIGIRSFGSNPEEVTQFGKKALEGYLAAGIIPCLKHFPGHGDVSCDPHYILPVVNKSLEELHAVELYPFKQLAKLSPAVMTAHIRFSQIDANCATLSSIFLNDILRSICGFHGVIITDSLTMQGVLEGTTIEEIAINAMNAGNDILLFGGRNLDDADEDKRNHIEEIGRVHQALVEAVQHGIISTERLDKSVARILKLKEQIAFFDAHSPGPLKESQRKKHCAIAKKIAKRSLELKKGDLPLRIKEKKFALLISDQLRSMVEATDFKKIGEQGGLFFFSEKEYCEEDFAPLLKIIDQLDGVFFISNKAKHPVWVDEIGKIKPLIYIGVKNFSKLEDYKNASIVIITNSPSTCVFQELYKNLYGDLSQ